MGKMDTSAVLVERLLAGASTTVLLVLGVAWLVHRIILTVELRMILKSLPRADRVTATVAYFASRSARGLRTRTPGEAGIVPEPTAHGPMVLSEPGDAIRTES